MDTHTLTVSKRQLDILRIGIVYLTANLSDANLALSDEEDYDVPVPVTIKHNGRIIPSIQENEIIELAAHLRD